ncbi:hypothetical protein ACIBJC_15105 [Streptomyces sp. NPDC050509]|uniref:hypothetical protein n=1 Tax=Streptomyces sp. NPDC050509 TaxID=3365620 RepID=UPI0037B6632C
MSEHPFPRHIVGEGGLALPYGSVVAVAREALAEAKRADLTNPLDIAASYGSLRAVVEMFLASTGPQEKDTPAAAGAEFTPLTVGWDREIIPPGDGDESVVCCSTGEGRPVALVLGPEEVDALGAELLGDDDGLAYQAYYDTERVGPLYRSLRLAVGCVTGLLVREYGEGVRERVSWATPAEPDEAVPVWDVLLDPAGGGAPEPTGYTVAALAVLSAHSGEEDGE